MGPLALSDAAVAECVGDIPWGQLKAVAEKHGVRYKTLCEMRTARRGKRPPKSARPVTLPPVHAHWSRRQKLAVLTAIADGQIAETAALQRYSITAEELASWRAGFAAAGLDGLCITKRRAA